MYRENKLVTILFILIIIGLFGVLAYTPFYLKEYKETLNKQHEEEKAKKQEEAEKNSIIPHIEESEPKESKPEESEINKEEKIKEKISLELTIEVNGEKYIANLEDNETTRAFIKKLPLEITMNELNGNEKYYELDEKLPSNPTKVEKINKGDLMLYGDDTIVLFYDTFETPYSYTKIGNIKENGMLKTNLGKKDVKVKFIYKGE